jgi:DNA-directed RNA polymerase subunit RPC12/RpoP
MAGLLGHISQEDREWLERNKGRCGPLGHKTVDDDYDGMYKDNEFMKSFYCDKCELDFELPEEKVKDKSIVCPICKNKM